MAIDPREIQLTPDQQRQLAFLSEHSGKQWPQLLSEVLGAYQSTIDESRTNGATSLYDALKQDGYLGVAAGGPTDMSTNPKFLEGFGRDR